MLHKDLRVDGKKLSDEKELEKYFSLPILLVKLGNWL